MPRARGEQAMATVIAEIADENNIAYHRAENGNAALAQLTYILKA